MWWWAQGAFNLTLLLYFGNERSFLHRSLVERLVSCLWGSHVHEPCVQ